MASQSRRKETGSDAVAEDSSSVLPIHTLPDDILREIFAFTVEFKDYSVPTQYVLCTVCHRWRQLVTRSPLLWTDIHIPGNYTYDSFRFFERSSPALFDVTFSSMSSWASSEMQLHSRVSEVIAKSVGRLRSLTIRVLSPQELPPLFLAWKNMEAPNFSELDIECFSMAFFNSIPDAGFGRFFVHGDEPMWLNGSSLRSLRLEGTSFSGFPPLSNLTTFEIDKMRVDTSGLRELFEKCPSLETLIVRRFGAPFHSDSELPTGSANIEITSLKSLAINLDNDHGDTCECALPYFSAPNLEFLEIAYLWPVLTEHHVAILSHLKTFTRLKRLRIQSNAFWERDASFLSSLPYGSDLEIIGFPKSGSSDSLLRILNLTNIHSIAIDLTSPIFTRELDIAGFYEMVTPKPPTLHCSITLCCEPPNKAAELKELLGAYFSVQSTPIQKRFLDDYLKKQIFDGQDDVLVDTFSGPYSDEEEEEDYDEDEEEQYYDYEAALELEQEVGLGMDFDDYEDEEYYEDEDPFDGFD